MSNTPNHGIPYVPEGVLDPAAGTNMALNVIDALIQLAVLELGINTPPGSPSDGDLYIVGTSPTGAWVGYENRLVRYVADGAFWQSYVAGIAVVLALNLTDGEVYKFVGDSGGGVWEAIGGGGLSVRIEDSNLTVITPVTQLRIGANLNATDQGGGAVLLEGQSGSSFEVATLDSNATTVSPCTRLEVLGKVVLTDQGGGTARLTIDDTVRDNANLIASVSNVLPVNYDDGDYFRVNLTQNITSWVFHHLPGSNKAATLMFRIVQDSSPRTVAWPASFKWAGGVAGAVSTGSGAVDLLAISTFDGGITWLATLAKAFA